MSIRRLRPEQARVIADALFAMARADGQIDAREVAVIDRFLAECADAAGEPHAPPASGPGPLDLVAATTGLRDAFLCACVMLAFADGDFTAEEAVVLRRYASELGVSDGHLDELVRVVEGEQALPPSPEPVPALLEVLAGWSHQHLPALRGKVERLIANG